MNNETYYIDEELGEFDNFFKSKKRKSCEQSYIDEGRTKKQAKIQCKTDMGGSALGRTLKVGALAIPRGAFSSLMRLNFRGFASRLKRAESNQPTEFSRATRKWISLGGKKENLIKVMNIGSTKKPLLCGASCKAKIEGKNFSGFSNYVDTADTDVSQELSEIRDYTDDELALFDAQPDLAYSNAVDPATASLIASGGAVLTAMASALSKTAISKNEIQANKEGQMAQSQMLGAENEAKAKRQKTLFIGIGILGLLAIGGMYVLRKRRKK